MISKKQKFKQEQMHYIGNVQIYLVVILNINKIKNIQKRSNLKAAVALMIYLTLVNLLTI